MTERVAYIEAAQQSTGFAEFYFLTYDGNYMTVTGKTGFSGASEFMKKFEGDEKKGDIIGHFGLGFYSVFMVSFVRLSDYDRTIRSGAVRRCPASTV